MLVLPAVNDASKLERPYGCARAEYYSEGDAQSSPLRNWGGVFIGRANFKTKTIHVVSIVPAPPDSRANTVCFFRGTQYLPERVAQISDATGGQLGYIGEWHTHPAGPDFMSPTDTETVMRFKEKFDTLISPLPVFLLIVTPTAFLPFVY